MYMLYARICFIIIKKGFAKINSASFRESSNDYNNISSKGSYHSSKIPRYGIILWYSYNEYLEVVIAY